MSPLPALRLTALGGCALLRDGAPLGAAASQRRPLAVLALVAAAGEAGTSRERILALLWPDAEPERARRTLTQTLYSLRRATDEEALFLGVTDVRLNPAVVACDLRTFDAALRQGRLADAVAAYHGPFLDGFQLPGAPEFEQWVESERRRQAGRCADALRTLARQAREAGDPGAEVAWCRRLCALDPVDSVAALALVDALGRAGDAAGAQRAVRVHEALVRDQLDLPLAPAIAARLQAILADQAAVATARPVAVAPLSLAEAVPTVEPTPPVQSAPPARRRRWPRVVGAALALAVGSSAVWIGVGRRPAPRPVAAPVVPADRGAIAVLPFALDTDDASLAFLREGAAELLARLLTGELGPRAVEPGAVLSALDSLPPPAATAGASAVRAHARTVARRVGAAEVLVGRIAGAPARLTLDAVLLDVASGAERAGARVSGPADSLSGLLDALAVRLVAHRTLDLDRAGAFAGATLPVLRAYLQAEAAAQAGRFQRAVTLYEQALARDTTFASAALGLAIAADKLNSAEQHDRGLALAWAARERLGARDHAYLLALAGPRYPVPSTAAEQLTAWEQAVALTPDRADAWSELAERFFYDGALLGIRNAEARAAGAFRRALALDPEDASARRHLIELAVRAGDRDALREVASPAQVRLAGGDLTGYLAWRVALATGDGDALARIRGRLPSLGVPSLRAIALASQHDGVALDDGARALRYLEARAVLGAEQLDALLARHSLALNQGRPVLALDVTEQLQDAQPGSRAHLRLRVLDALYSEGDEAAAVAAAGEMARIAAAGPAPDERERALRVADACVLGQWRAAPWRRSGRPTRDELADARRAAAVLRAAAMPRTTVPVAASPPACAALVEAMVAVSSGARDARARVDQLDAQMLTGPALGDASAWATLAVAHLYDGLGDAARAANAVRQRPYLKGWPRYLASSLRLQARLARAAGDSATADAALRRYRVLRAAPESAVGAVR